jgi:DNA repair protein RadC
MLYPIVIGKNITTAVIAHNHPSGVLTPSAEDIVATERICKVMAYLDIGLQDYLIITADDCISIMNDLY